MKSLRFSNSSNIFIVVAAYNEARSIQSVIGRLLEKYQNIVVVDDGSIDDTWEILCNLNVFSLKHTINRGQGAALQTGIQFALLRGAEIIVTFDADGQHDECDIQSLVEPILTGEYDVVLGSRFLGRAMNITFTRKMILKLGVLFTQFVSRISISDVHNGLRAFSREAAASLNITMDRMAHASEILDQIKMQGWHFKEVPVTIYYSDYSKVKGQSSWNAVKIALQILLNRSTR